MDARTICSTQVNICMLSPFQIIHRIRIVMKSVPPFVSRRRNREPEELLKQPSVGEEQTIAHPPTTHHDPTMVGSSFAASSSFPNSICSLVSQESKHTLLLLKQRYISDLTRSPKNSQLHRQRQQNQRPRKFGQLWEKTHWDLETEPVWDSLFYDWPECPSVSHEGLANNDQ